MERTAILVKSSALNFTVWDLAGAPLDPQEIERLIRMVETFVMENKLVCQVVTDER